MSAKKSALLIELERSIQKLLKEVMDPKTRTEAGHPPSLTDKMKVVDRAIKLEALNAKMQDNSFGSGFFDNEDETEG
jgi:hypothetical protein